MVTFLQEVLSDIKKEHSDISEIKFILPSRRAGGFLRQQLKRDSDKTQFAPIICSVEEFIEDIANIQIIDSTELLFKSYEVYLKTSPIVEKEEFEVYATWAISLLNDFNEIDRYLVEPKPFFEYLASVKTLERWGVGDEKTTLVTNYLRFWNSLFEFYTNLKTFLLNEKIGYQGLVYRNAADSITSYIEKNISQKHVFVGFNALNSAEQNIIQQLLEKGNAEIYWDTDKVFYDDSQHSSSKFIRKYLKEWNYFQTAKPKFISDNFNSKKKFNFVEAQKNIGQAKYVGKILATLSEEELNNTAVVLGDESLLMPLLYSLPKNVNNLNVTMGTPLKLFPAVVFFELLFSLHIKESDTLYYKNIVAILNHPLGAKLLPNASKLSQKLTTDNSTHISVENLITLDPNSENGILKLLFGSWENSSNKALDVCKTLLTNLQEIYNETIVEKMVVFQLLSVFEKIDALNDKYPHLKTVKTVQGLFTELAATTSLDFKGDAYEGLQIMGVLETRVLDFENLIITSVNEGIFPSGKSNASFITYDLKAQFNLPLFNDKDAIYTYHFYRMLHRAANVTLLYNSVSDGLNSGEKSRFLRQLEIEKNPNHEIDKLVLSPKVQIKQAEQKQIVKTDSVMQRLEEIAGKGFSPSALTNYIRNPIDFYFQKILQLQEFEEVEETVAANTLGTIIHDTLENFYKPLEGQFLKIDDLEGMKVRIDDEVGLQFEKTFKGGNISRGKNLIIFEVAKRYIFNFLNKEIEEIKSGNQIKIVQIETNLELKIPIPKISFPVKIRGKVDRVDEYNGQLRIIDYKTGKVEQAALEITDWETLNDDYKNSKAFQVLAYALMINQEISVQGAEAEIISFKNLNRGFLKFGKKEEGSRKKEQLLTQSILDDFKEQLSNLITEICNQEIPFTEKEID